MLIDAHTHLQPHGGCRPVDRALIERYAEAALAAGLDGIVFTEHLFRFREAYDLLDGWWNADPNPQLAATTAAYWRDHVNLRLSEYVALIEDAKSAGLPVFLGIEMDWIPGKAAVLRRMLAPYAWDLVLGAVHWVGAFGFDSDEFIDEWDRRDVDAVYAEYTRLLVELAGSGLADAIAHADRPKVFGHRPSDPAPFHAAVVAAAVRNGLALEINTKGLRSAARELYPAPELIALAHAAGVPVTLASDAHVAEGLGQDFAVAIRAARAAGYEGYVRFERRRRIAQPFR
ncbi:MAG TPA: histidinol-phosphatase HisJ family protein [Dehalococcoidia bacterium]|nr:histidinol-phosphatase HisJ family protein [Dehalococcoidia bacterium]